MNLRSRAVAADPQRLAARAVFGAMLALLLVLVMLPLGKSIAQTTTTINIINPHPTTSLVISDKGGPYHLNSWVNQVPPSPLVEYELVDADNNPTTIGTATQVGTDTFEYFWTIDETTLPDGDYILRATLFTQGTTTTEVATDTQEVVLNNQQGDLPAGVPDADDPAETVEIVYPVNAGDLGVYVTPGSPSESSFIMEVQSSADNRFVKGFYSTTERGSEPEFKACGGFRTVDPEDALTFECTVAATDFGLDITAVAASTNDTPSPATAGQTQAAFNDGADAHSVDAYFQRPGNVLLEPQTIGDAALSSCVTFVATVTDQNTRPIANINVDGHGSGPDDNLRFDTGTSSTSTANDTKAPDQNHSSTTEPAFECSFTPVSDTDAGDDGAPEGTQGDHNDPTGADRKHVESVTGTDVNGQVPFSLRSATAGGTLLTVWADTDDDDQFCSQEQAEAGSIGWGQPAPAPALETAEVATCTVAEPTPGATPTAEPTATATSTSTPEPTPSDGSPSPDPTTDPDDGDRQFTKFAASKNAVRKGGFVRFNAVLNADDPATCEQGVAVKLKAKRVGGRFITLKTKVTNTEGQVRFRVQVKRTKIYKAVAPPEGFCERAKSEQKKVRRK